MLRYYNTQQDLFESNNECQDQQKALEEIIYDDFYSKRTLPFVDVATGQSYVRHYSQMPQGNVGMIIVGYFREVERGDETILDFPYVTIIINNSKRKYQPYIVIVDYKPAFSSVKYVVDMLKRALNWAFARKNIIVDLEPWNDAPDDWIIDCVMAYYKGKKNRFFNPMALFGFEMIEARFVQKKVKKPERKMGAIKSMDIHDYILHSDPELVILLLGESVKNLEHAQEIAKRIRFLQDKKVVIRIFYGALITAYPYLKNRMSESVFNGYMIESIHPFEGDPLNAKFEEFFAPLL